MASLLSLPDELLVRILNYVRLQAEFKLLSRVLDKQDMEGSVAMPCHDELQSLASVCRKWKKLLREPLYHSQHVWSPQTIHQLVVSGDVHDKMRSLRIDHAELLAGYHMDSATLVETWLAMLNPLLPLLQSNSSLRHLHIALPKDNGQPTNAIIAAVEQTAFVPPSLRTLSLKSGGPMLAFSVLASMLRDRQILSVDTLRLESITARDFIAVPNGFQPFIRTRHLSLFDVFSRDAWFSFQEGGLEPFFDVFLEPLPLSLTITKSRMASSGHLLQIISHFGPHLERLHLSLSEISTGQVSGSYEYILEGLCPAFVAGHQPQAPETQALKWLLGPCRNLQILKLDLLDYSPLLEIAIPPVRVLCLPWHVGFVNPQVITYVLQDQPLLQTFRLDIQLNLDVLENHAFMERGSDVALASERIGLVACVELCRHRRIIMEPPNVLEIWDRKVERATPRD